METAYGNDLASGYGDGTFGPDRNITREEIVAMIMRALAQNGQAPVVADANAILNHFADASQISSWAREAAARQYPVV